MLKKPKLPPNMDTKVSPYEPITPELAASGLLRPIKKAAAAYDCCEGTLKDNAKARRLRAFQAHFGAPVMVLLSDVEDFLKARPDIHSVSHPKQVAASPEAAGDLPAPWNVGAASSTPANFSFPLVAGPPAGGLGELGNVRLKSLDNATPGEVALVARCLAEISSMLNRSSLPGEANL